MSFGEVRTLDQLPDEGASLAALRDAVDLRDVRMIEGRQDLRLSLEPSEAIRVSGEGVWEDLQRDVPAELGVGGAIHLPHAPLADEDGDVVVAEAGADVQRHCCRSEPDSAPILAKWVRRRTFPLLLTCRREPDWLRPQGVAL